jgi:hypothetical protein
MIDNLKPKIGNQKSEGFAQRAGATGQGDQMKTWSGGVMECWVNPVKSITPVLQHSNSPNAIAIVSYPLRPALCALLGRRGAAVSESPPSAILARTDAFRLGLRELEYMEGKNIVIGVPISGDSNRVKSLAADCRSANVRSLTVRPTLVD